MRLSEFGLTGKAGRNAAQIDSGGFLTGYRRHVPLRVAGVPCEALSNAIGNGLLHRRAQRIAEHLPIFVGMQANLARIIDWAGLTAYAAIMKDDNFNRMLAHPDLLTVHVE